MDKVADSPRIASPSDQDMADMLVFMERYQGNPTQLSPAQCLVLMERVCRLERLLKEAKSSGLNTHDALMKSARYGKLLLRRLELANAHIKSLEQRLKDLDQAIPILAEEVRTGGEETGRQAETAVQHGRVDGVQVSEVEGTEAPEVPERPDGG